MDKKKICVNFSNKLLIAIGVLFIALLVLIIIFFCNKNYISEYERVVLCLTPNSEDTVISNLEKEFGSVPQSGLDTLKSVVLNCDESKTPIRITKVYKGKDSYDIACIKESSEDISCYVYFNVVVKFNKGELEWISVY